jgi:riboflavin biosynthesis pyrimidine reductase
MTEPAIGRLFPLPSADKLSDAEIAALYDKPLHSPWLRVNFVSSLDGAATVDGLSGGLGDDADHRVFDLLRRICDVVVVGAGTVRAEGYGAMRVDAAAQTARRTAGLTDHPVFALVSAGLDLDPERADPGRRDALAAVADVVVCGVDRVEPALLVRELAGRGLSRIHCEGGPHLFGDLISAGAVDELCLTLSPALAAGSAPRIATGAAAAAPVGMRLAHVLGSGSTLLLRYVRD